MATTRFIRSYEADVCSFEAFVLRPGETVKVKAVIRFKDDNRQPVSVAAAKRDVFETLGIQTDPGNYCAVIVGENGSEIMMGESMNTLFYKDAICDSDVIVFRLK